MIGCTSMERHIVSSSLKSPLERLAGAAMNPWELIDVPANHTREIDARCHYLYVNITKDSHVSEEVWSSIQYQIHKAAHAILYTLNFKLDPGSRSFAGYQELALYPLRQIREATPTFAAFEWVPDGSEEGVMVASTYSLRPVALSGA